MDRKTSNSLLLRGIWFFSKMEYIFLLFYIYNKDARKQN